MPFAVTGSHSHLSVCPPLGLVQSWPEPAGVTVTGQKWKNGKNVWVLAITPSPSDHGAAAGPFWGQLVPGPGPSLWLSGWDSECPRPHMQTGLKIPLPAAPPPRRKGGPGNYCWIDCPPPQPPTRSRALGRAVGRAWMESEALTWEARTCQPPPSLALPVWFGSQHVSILFKNLISCQHLQIGELHRKVRISVL